MPTPALDGPFPLCNKHLVSRVTRRAPGIFLLSATRGGEIDPRRVERSDDDVAEHLKHHIGLYSHFAWAYASSPMVAYDMECEMYHTWRPPENINHPEKPTGTDCVCPVCGR
jgi:hypothetical protein